MQRKLTSSTTLDNLRKEAKRWLKALREKNAEARERFERAYPKASGEPVLRDVQQALAREYGQESWNALRESLERTPAKYERLAQDWVNAYEGDAAALERLNEHGGRSFNFEDLRAELWRRVYAFRQRSSKVPKNYLQVDEAKMVIAQDAGFGSWAQLMQALKTGSKPQGAPYVIDGKENRIGPRRQMTDADWDALIGAAKEQRITGVYANGLITDAVLGRIAELDQVTRLGLGGSRELTDEGLRHLARMPQLQHLELNEYPGGRITDRGLEVLRDLPNLRTFEMTWQAGISDAGVANLRFCEQLERVDLMGSPTGDGAIEALQGKSRLSHFSSGRLVTDAGIPLLRNFPALRKLLVDGPFSNEGLAGIAGIDSLLDLDLFWHVCGITSEGFAHLVQLPNLESLGCDGKLSDDAAMGHIAAIPRLKRLRVQESVATDDGFVSLGKSKSIESIWGRVCPNFGNRGFRAFSKMPALRGFGIGCRNVDDETLATLPDFPRCGNSRRLIFRTRGSGTLAGAQRLERLTCMYCRETGDVATEHIAGLGLKYYYAGLTQITDRSLAVLGRMESLEQVDLVRVQGRHRCRSAIAGGTAAPARGPSGWAAGGDAGRNAGVSRRRASLLFDVIVMFLPFMIEFMKGRDAMPISIKNDQTELLAEARRTHRGNAHRRDSDRIGGEVRPAPPGSLGPLSRGRAQCDRAALRKSAGYLAAERR